MKDYYGILGVSGDASAEEIKKAFRRLARETHPDANPGDAEAEHRFREIAEAYEVLSDPEKRKLYDEFGEDAGFGAAAAGHVIERVEAAFTAQGFRVARNAPFAGAYIAQTYGRPARGQHAIQVEIDRALYMDERLIKPNANS